MNLRSLLGFVMLPTLGGCAAEAVRVSTQGADGAGATAFESFCQGRPLLHFCEDFDVRPLPGGFLPPTANNTIDLVIAPSMQAASSPNVLNLRAGPNGGAVWLRTPAAAQKGRVNALVMVQIHALTRSLAFAAFELGDGRIELSVEDGAYHITEKPIKGPPKPHKSEAPVVVGESTSIRWDMRAESGGTWLRLRIDDTTVFEREPLESLPLVGDVSLAVGLETAGAAHVSLDSITFEPASE